jgi:ABC-2 type transport system permease protein
MQVIILAFKDLRRIVSDRKSFVISLALPFLLTFIMGLSFGGGLFGKTGGISAIPVALVAGDLPDMLKQPLADGLAETGFFQATWTDTAQAAAWVKEGEVAAAVVLPSDFTERFFSYEEVAVEVWKDPASQLKAGIVEEVIRRLVVLVQANEAAYVTLWPETADPVENQKLEDWAEKFFAGDFADIWQRVRQGDQNSELEAVGKVFLTGMDRQMALVQALQEGGIALSVDDKAPSGEGEEQGQVNLFNYFLPNFAVFFLMFNVAASCRDLHRERAAGTLQRQLLAPLRPGSLVLGKWLAASGQGILMLSVLFLAGGILYRVDLAAAPLSLAAIVILCSTAASSVFMLLALISPTEKYMDNLTTVVILVSAMLGGNMIPLDNLPAWMAGVGQFMFNYWANLSFQNILMESRGIGSDPQPALVLFGVSFGLLALNLVLFRWRVRRGGLI